MRPERLFRIASNSKPFLATMAVLLQRDGRLDLDAPAARWLAPALTSRIANAKTATVRQRLQHTSGIFDALGTDQFWEAAETSPQHVWRAEEALFQHG